MLSNIINYLRDIAWFALSAFFLAVFVVLSAIFASPSGTVVLAIGFAATTMALLSMKE